MTRQPIGIDVSKRRLLPVSPPANLYTILLYQNCCLPNRTERLKNISFGTFKVRYDKIVKKYMLQLRILKRLFGGRGGNSHEPNN